MPLPQQDEFGVIAALFNAPWLAVSMPLPQQDEFGVGKHFGETKNLPKKSQCRFRSKMNSESENISGKQKIFRVSMPLPQQDEFGGLPMVVSRLLIGGLNAASAAR